MSRLVTAAAALTAAVTVAACSGSEAASGSPSSQPAVHRTAATPGAFVAPDQPGPYRVGR